MLNSKKYEQGIYYPSIVKDIKPSEIELIKQHKDKWYVINSRATRLLEEYKKLIQNEQAKTIRTL